MAGLRFTLEIEQEQEQEPIEAFATVRITVLGEDTCPKNWWLCCPKPDPGPVPERPTDFVPLDQYDLEFTYPLKSSRKPSRNPIQDDCVNCGPVFVAPAPPVPEPDPEPEPEPDPELIAHIEAGCSIDEMIYGVYWEDLEGNHVNTPSWWNPNTEFTLKWGSWEGVYSDKDTIISQEGTPPMCCDSLDPYGILRQGDNAAYFTVVWYCG